MKGKTSAARVEGGAQASTGSFCLARSPTTAMSALDLTGWPEPAAVAMMPTSAWLQSPSFKLPTSAPLGAITVTVTSLPTAFEEIPLLEAATTLGTLDDIFLNVGIEVQTLDLLQTPTDAFLAVAGGPLEAQPLRADGRPAESGIAGVHRGSRETLGLPAPAPNVVQIWQVTAPSTGQKNYTPRLGATFVYSVLVDGGMVSTLQWAPSVPAADPLPASSLGLLAVVSGDGLLRIFRMPRRPADGQVLSLAPLVTASLPGCCLECVEWHRWLPLTLASGASDGSVVVWKFTKPACPSDEWDGEPWRILSCPAAPRAIPARAAVLSVSWCPGGGGQGSTVGLLASIDVSGVLRVWDLDSAQPLITESTVERATGFRLIWFSRLAWLPDATGFLVTGPGMDVVYRQDWVSLSPTTLQTDFELECIHDLDVFEIPGKGPWAMVATSEGDVLHGPATAAPAANLSKKQTAPARSVLKVSSAVRRDSSALPPSPSVTSTASACCSVEVLGAPVERRTIPEKRQITAQGSTPCLVARLFQDVKLAHDESARALVCSGGCSGIVRIQAVNVSDLA